MKRVLTALLGILLVATPAAAQIFGSSIAPAVPAVALPSALGTPGGIYTVVKPIGWSGHCAQIQRTDTTTLNIDWTAGNLCDKGAADTFCKNTTCGVSKWYDTSGNGNDCVQATQANQATFSNLNEWLGIRPISLQGVTGAAIFQSLRCPAVGNRNALSVYHVLAPRTSYGFNVQWEFADSGYSTAYAQIYNAGTALSTNLGSPISFGLYSRAHVNITSTSSGPSGQIVRTNGQQAANAGVATSQAFGGLQIGQSLAGNNYNALQDEFALVWYPATHTSAQMKSVEAALSASFAPQTSFTNRLVYGGSSLIVSFYSTLNQTAPWQGGFGRGSTWETYAMAVGGQTLTTECSTNLAALQSLYNPGAALNVAVLDADSNGIANQTSFANNAAAVAFADSEYTTVLLPCVAALKATGFKVVVPTIIGRTGFQLGTGNFLDDARVEENLQIVNGASPSTTYTLSDRAANPLLANTAATLNKSCYASDGIHLTNFCYGVTVMEGADKPAILSIH